MAELKTRANDSDVLKFINGVKDEQRREDCKTLLRLFTEVTKENPIMWGASIVGYGSYHYKYASGREGDWPLTGFSPRKDNLTIYIMSGFTKYPDIMKTLGKYKTGSSCLYIKKLSDIDSAKLKSLIKKSIADMKKLYPATVKK